mmetsp:Transcript_3321/g.6586  ORF Transcript_3321/g.6586 Transcript_3321/m.6586 type:complete len:198 (+) Transcript_3321:18-611(+)
MLTIRTIGLALAGVYCATAEITPPVPTNLTNYAGRWYQMYTDVYVASTFEKGAYCVTADYRLNADNTVSVFNSQALDSVVGPLGNVTGTAYATDTPGVLSVVFTPGDASPFPAPYWVIKLGPVVDGLYDYAVVSDNHDAGLYVLARDPASFPAAYDAEVTAFLAASGFTGRFTTPVSTVQQADCHYAGDPVFVDPVF